MCLLRSLCGVIIANVRVECGDKHQRLVHDLVQTLLVCLDAHHAVICEERNSESRRAKATDVSTKKDVALCELAVRVCGRECVALNLVICVDAIIMCL